MILWFYGLTAWMDHPSQPLYFSINKRSKIAFYPKNKHRVTLFFILFLFFILIGLSAVFLYNRACKVS